MRTPLRRRGATAGTVAIEFGLIGIGLFWSPAGGVRTGFSLLRADVAGLRRKGSGAADANAASRRRERVLTDIVSIPRLLPVSESLFSSCSRRCDHAAAGHHFQAAMIRRPPFSAITVNPGVTGNLMLLQAYYTNPLPALAVERDDLGRHGRLPERVGASMRRCDGRSTLRGRLAIAGRVRGHATRMGCSARAAGSRRSNSRSSHRSWLQPARLVRPDHGFLASQRVNMAALAIAQIATYQAANSGHQPEYPEPDRDPDGDVGDLCLSAGHADGTGLVVWRHRHLGGRDTTKSVVHQLLHLLPHVAWSGRFQGGTGRHGRAAPVLSPGSPIRRPRRPRRCQPIFNSPSRCSSSMSTTPFSRCSSRSSPATY